MKGLVNGMKKYLCILLAFVLVLTLAACGGDPGSDLPDPEMCIRDRARRASA